MKTHVAVVGAYGSAGVAVADRLAAEPDVELTLIDDGDPGGGLCILEGCMPSKELLTAAERRFAARDDERLRGAVPDVDFERVIEHKDDNISTYASGRRSHVQELADRDDVTLRRETAAFVDDRRLAVGDDVLEPDYVVVATGSTPNVPPIPGIEDVPFETSADVLDATEFGESGLVIGLGVIGLELVPYLSEAAGMDLTVVEQLPAVLPDADPAFGDALVDYYEDRFDVDVRLDTGTKGLEATDDGGVRAILDDDGTETAVAADQLFVFTGRKPALDRLGLDETRLTPEPGWVADTMQARDDERVFVVGDANGTEPILHVAKEEGAVAAENVLRHRDGEPLEPYENVTHQVVFSGLTELPYARLGHTASSASEAGIDHVVATREVSGEGVFRSRNYSEGLARLVVGTDGTVLGYQGLHPDADVMAKTMQLAVEMELDVRDIPDRAYHPTTPEIIDGLLQDAAAALDG
ncbi:dihydrolipoyl dehydrogenase family protein [Halorientalis brevis]|uniref:Dihydrolipoyl dehydrogenase family protein n=1 Tax=Halorientalis brevis TaxID=1126241 RepID=A0ABD6C8G1_9EURY|nr:NAD(P)/FAD-dependent oxidoreductase [Halorientalis brevis]